MATSGFSESSYPEMEGKHTHPSTNCLNIGCTATELFEEDRKYLKHVYELQSEDYIKNPGKYHTEIAAFIGTTVPENAAESVTGAYNKKYLDRWCKLVTSSPGRNYYQYIAIKYEPRFAKYGYSLIKGLTIDKRTTSNWKKNLRCCWPLVLPVG